MKTNTRRRLVPVLAVALALTLSACSGVDGARHAVEGLTSTIETPTTTSTSTNFDISTSPDYYAVDGPAQGVDLDADGIAYGDLDAHGRATGAGGVITGAMRAEARSRDRDRAPEMPDPAGWPRPNPRVEIKGTQGRRDYHGYLWNRSHLVAWSLGGDMGARNLVTGTRTQNVGDNTASHPGGMAYTETLARDWLDAHPDGRLYYRATPVYEGDESIPRTVTVDVKSDDGTIDAHVTVYNAANGFMIDYATGAATEVRNG